MYNYSQCGKRHWFITSVVSFPSIGEMSELGNVGNEMLKTPGIILMMKNHWAKSVCLTFNLNQFAQNRH